MLIRSPAWCRLCILLLVDVALSSIVLAGTTGILEGKVTDSSSGEILVGVNVTIAGTHLGAASDVDGIYQVNNVQAGIYDVHFRLVGFKTLVMRRVTILPDLRTRIDVALESSPVELQAIEVQADRPLIQKDLPATAYQIGQIKLEKLPITAFRELLTLQPGTTLEGNVRGGKTNEVIFLVDGLPVQDVIGGGLGTNLPRSSITGLTIHTGGFEAEYGNAMSGVVNVVTRSGGPTHKVFLRYERDSWLPERWNKQQDRATDVEVTASGPIIEDNLTYFTANTVSTSDTRWWQDFDRSFLSPVSQEFTGFAKAEYHFSPGLRLGVQGIYSLQSWRDYEFSWRFNLGGLPPRTRNSYRLALLLSHTLSTNSFYTISASRYYHRSEVGDGSGFDEIQPYEYDFFLRYIVGGKRNWWADTRQVIYTVKGDYTAQIGRAHTFRAGVEVNHYDVTSEVFKFEPRTTYFGKPILEAEMLNFSNRYKYFPRSGSIYLQDKVEIVRDGSSFSAGLRWDFLDPTAERPIVEFVPVRPNEYEQVVTGTTRAKFKHQLSPRLAFSAPVGPSSFFFINFGHYFQFPLFDYLYSGVNPAQLRFGVKNVRLGNPDLEPERSIAWEAGIKHGFAGNHVASATYFRKKFKNQIDSKTLVPFDSKAAGDYGFASYVNNAEAEASGIELLVSRERDERFTGSISYTYMIAEGISEYVDQSINLAQWGFPLAVRPYPLSWDQRHTVKVDAEFSTFFGIQTNMVVLYNSPRPYTFYPTRDGFVPLDSTKTFVPNNARMGNVWFVNVKATRSFRMDALGGSVFTIFVDVRNLFNSRNIRWIDSSGRVGGELGDPGAYYDPRRVRVGMRLELGG